MLSPHLRDFGLGLRKPHYPAFLAGEPDVDFVEVISENFMIDGGRPRQVLREVRERYPVALHGVSMSIGSADGVDRTYLARLRALVDEVEPFVVSDHLCWTRVAGFNSHDLLPLPYTREALDTVCVAIGIAQDTLGRSLLIENPSTYVAFDRGDWNEAGFLAEMCARSGCGLLLDVNNVYVSATNQGCDPIAWIDAMPARYVRQIHLAGHSQGRELLVDTHDTPVCAEVWRLLARIAPSLGDVAVMVERDDDIPPLDDLLAELAVARETISQAARQDSLA